MSDEQRTLFPTNPSSEFLDVERPESEDGCSAAVCQSFFEAHDARRFFLELCEHVPWQQDYIRMYGGDVRLPRRTAWFGDSGKTYTYSGITMSPHRVDTIDGLVELKQRVEEAAHTVFNSVLLNLYESGADSVSWHSDDEPELGLNPTIASVSLGAERMFRLRHKPTKKTAGLILADGSLLMMKGRLQELYEHCLPKTTAKNLRDSKRINLTFRQIVA